MSGRGITAGGRKALFSVGVPFMSFMVLGSYGLSEWVGAKMRIKEEKKQQEKVLEEIRDREKRLNKRILSGAPKPKKKFDPNAEYEEMMRKSGYTAEYENKPGVKVGETRA